MLQPFKYITVVMKDKTNHGVTSFHDDPKAFMDRYELAGDLRYTPVTLNDDGLGVGYMDDNKSQAVIGILMESFNKPLAQHKVLVHGIVPMKAEADVRAGNYVYWSTATNSLVKTNGGPTETPFIGRAMTSSKVGGGIIDVLIV